MSDAWLTSEQYMEGVRVQIDKPKLTADLSTQDHLVQFGVTRWFHELAEEGITVNLTPEQARELGNRLLVLYVDAQQKRGLTV